MIATLPFAQLKLSDSSFKNPRTSSGLDERSIVELALHIGLHGLLNAPVVRSDGMVIAGQRRYKAIEWLLRWFSATTPTVANPLPVASPIERELMDSLTHADVSIIEATAAAFVRDGIPVRVLGGSTSSTHPGRFAGLALADNVQRSDLSTFEEAQALTDLLGQDLTQADIVRIVGKSKTWVSRRISTFQKSITEVRDAWATGAISFDTAHEISQLGPMEQTRRIAGTTPRGIRGPANRPGIDTVKEFLGELEQKGLAQSPRLEVGAARYATGVRDALRWIVGDATSEDFAKLVGGNDARH